MEQPERNDRKTLILMILGIAVVVFFTAHGTLTLDPSVKMKIAMSLADHGDIQMRLTDYEEQYMTHYTMARVKGPDGNYYSGYHGIGQILLFTPFYYVARHVLGIESEKLQRTFVSLTLFPLQLALVGWIFFLLLREFDFMPRQCFIAALLLVFATGLWQLSKEAQDGIHVAFCFCLCGYGLRRFQKTGGWRYLALLGVSIGYAFVTRSDVAPTVLCALLFAAYLIHQHSRQTVAQRSRWAKAIPYLLLVALTAPFLIFHIWHNMFRFGNPVMCAEHPYNQVHFTWAQRWDLFCIGFKGLLYSPGKGIFWYNPILLLAIPGGAMLWKMHRSWAVFIFCGFAGCFLLHAAVPNFHGNLCWGPRYLCRYFPLLLVPGALFLFSPAVQRWWLRTVVLAIVGASLVVQIASVSIHYQRELDELSLAYGGWSVKQWTMFEPEAHILENRFRNIAQAVDEMAHDRIPPWPQQHTWEMPPEEAAEAPVLRYLAFWPYHLTYYLPAIKPAWALPLWASTLLLLAGVGLGMFILWLGWRLCAPSRVVLQDKKNFTWQRQAYVPAGQGT